jgi:hypothetical protein
VAEAVARFREKFEESAVGGGISAIQIIIHRLLKENVAQYYKAVSKIEKLDDGVIPAVYGLVGGLLADRVELPGWDSALSVGIAEVLKGVYARYVQKEPIVIALDASTIEVYNLDANAEVKVVIDGSAVSFQTAPKTDSNGYAKITLPSAMSPGKHEIVAMTSKKAAYAKVVV